VHTGGHGRGDGLSGAAGAYQVRRCEHADAVALVAQRGRDVGADGALAVRAAHVDHAALQGLLRPAQLAQDRQDALQAQVDRAAPAEGALHISIYAARPQLFVRGVEFSDTRWIWQGVKGVNPRLIYL
jgi:hypothetical protein